MVSLVVCSSKEATRRCCRTLLVVSGWCATVGRVRKLGEFAIVFGCCWSRYGEDEVLVSVLGGGEFILQGFGAARVRGKRRCAGGGLRPEADRGKGKRGERVCEALWFRGGRGGEREGSPGGRSGGDNGGFSIGVA
ncbi:hypothetical protein HAX54_034689 [Datura stramonium]|uniref:Uncharacterized protein n=1 Tax=Datura stramonium TaxID=4076 RepID=A0ABS8VI59_DATST|nr:hypothetical protein [Datura stramonium]